MDWQVKYLKGFGKLTGPNSVTVALNDGGEETITAKNIMWLVWLRGSFSQFEAEPKCSGDSYVKTAWEALCTNHPVISSTVLHEDWGLLPSSRFFSLEDFVFTSWNLSAASGHCKGWQLAPRSLRNFLLWRWTKNRSSPPPAHWPCPLAKSCQVQPYEYC